MNDSKRGIGRVALYGSVIGAMVLSILPAAGGQVAAAGQTCRKINNQDVCGRFLEEWSKKGSEQNNVYVNGLPITARRPEISTEDGKVYETQWFERARFEAHPENRAPYDVLFGRLGAVLAEGRGSVDPATRQVRNPADRAFVGIDQPGDVGPTKVWFRETRHTISGKILEYWNRYGGLAQFGFPLSEEFDEISATDGKTYKVQYFERNRFELHPEKAAPYEVELGLLGVQQYKQTPIAADQIPIAPPKNVTSAKDTIKIGSSQEPADLTIFNNALINSRMRRFIEMGLTDRDDNENVYPQIAWFVPTIENGGASFVGTGEDRHLQVKYKLRRGIKWSDGQEVDSNDAVFLYKLIMNPQSPVVSRSEYQRLENVDNPDKYTVIYRYRSLRQVTAFYNSLTPGDRPNYGFIEVFVTQKKPVISITYSEVGGIYPEHVVGRIPPAQIKESNFARSPIGAGPWRVERWTTGQEMILVENPNYNLTDKPLIKRIEVKFITDVNQLEAQFKTGNLDLISSEAYVIPPADAAGIQAAGGKIVSRAAATWEHADFYFDYEPFKDRAVREAIISAINRQRIVQVAFRGAGGVQNGVVPPSVPFSLENPDFAKNFPEVAAQYKLPVYAYDPAKAASLLDGAGWRCPAGTSGANCGGQTRQKGGQSLSFEYATTINAVRQQIQGLVQADLKAVGVDAQVKSYPAGVFFDAPGPRSDGTTKFAQFAWVGSSSSDFGAWRCDEVYNRQTNAGVNEQRYCNPKVDDADGKFQSDLDPKVGVAGHAEAQVTIMQDIAVVPLATRANIEVVNGKLQNHKESNSQVTSNWNAVQWYFTR
jgi:peptide/nickel transport system substrate-binding protein